MYLSDGSFTGDTKHVKSDVTNGGFLGIYNYSFELKPCRRTAFSYSLLFSYERALRAMFILITAVYLHYRIAYKKPVSLKFVQKHYSTKRSHSRNL